MPKGTDFLKNEGGRGKVVGMRRRCDTIDHAVLHCTRQRIENTISPEIGCDPSRPVLGAVIGRRDRHFT